MSETTFRTAKEADTTEKAPAPEPKNPDKVITGSPKTEVPIALYGELEGKPYSAVYFDVEGIWDNPDIGLKQDLEVIEQAYKAKVQFKELEDGKDSFEAMIKEAEKATDTKNAEKTFKIVKLAEWFRFMNKMDQLDRKKLWA